MLSKPFKEDSKVDGVFGETRGYGFHSGVDENGTGGGNTDCGYKLYPIKEGTIVHASHSTTGYGNIVVCRIEGEFGERWVRYCHCREILINSGEVTQDTPIATLGTSGNSTACHLHWDVIKKPLRNWRTYAKTEELLNEYFEDPTAFFNRWKDVEDKEDMPDYFTKLLIEYNLNLDNEGQIREWFGRARDYENNQNRIQELTQQVESLTAVVSQFEGLSTRIKQLEEESVGLREDLTQARIKLAEANSKTNALANQVTRLEGENERLKENNNIMAYSWFTRLASLFQKRG